MILEHKIISVLLVMLFITGLVAWQGWYRASLLSEQYSAQLIANTDGLNMLYAIEIQRANVVNDSLRKELDKTIFFANYWRTIADKRKNTPNRP